MTTDESQKKNFAGICLMAPAVVATGLAVVAMPIVVTIISSQEWTLLAAFQAGAAAIPAVIIACFVLWMRALPGVYAPGYPLLRLLIAIFLPFLVLFAIDPSRGKAVNLRAGGIP